MNTMHRPISAPLTSELDRKSSTEILVLRAAPRVPLLAAFDPRHLAATKHLWELARYNRGDIVVQELQPGGSFFVILRGIVTISKHTGLRDTILAILGQGEFFGEMNLFSDVARSATVRARSAVDVLYIHNAAMMEAIVESPSVARVIMQCLTDRVRAANDRITCATTLDVRSRMMGTLADLALRFGEPDANGTRITFRFTNQELADMVGTTRETASRTINRLWDEHLIDMRSTHVVVPDPVGLAKKSRESVA